jgi:hypothetical protein
MRRGGANATFGGSPTSDVRLPVHHPKAEVVPRPLPVALDNQRLPAAGAVAMFPGSAFLIRISE